MGWRADGQLAHLTALVGHHRQLMPAVLEQARVEREREVQLRQPVAHIEMVARFEVAEVLAQLLISGWGDPMPAGPDNLTRVPEAA